MTEGFGREIPGGEKPRKVSPGEKAVGLGGFLRILAGAVGLKFRAGQEEESLHVVARVLLKRWPMLGDWVGVKSRSNDSTSGGGKFMDMLMKLLTGGFFKGYRTQLLGIATILGTLAYAFIQYLVGDLDFWGFLEVLKANWMLLYAGFIALFVGDKIDRNK